MTETDHADKTCALRPGEELDTGRLRAYLAANLPAEHAAGMDALALEQFPGGHSNLTYLVRAGAREYVLRRPPHGTSVPSAHDMSREFHILSRLAPVYAKAPAPVLFCDDETIIGGQFYLMERRRGVIIRREPLPGMQMTRELAAGISTALIDALVELHLLDYYTAGLSDYGKPEGYVERQISGWTRRYAAAQTDELADATAVGRWLAQNLPGDSAPALIHNDFKLDNVILDPDQPTRILAVLDWEMATIGDPLMDLGTTLGYWVEDGDHPLIKAFRFCPTDMPGMLTRAEIVERYARATGRDIASILYYYCFGLFKSAVVGQQIYYRYKHGHTSDPRFVQIGRAVRVLFAQATAALERGHI